MEAKKTKILALAVLAMLCAVAIVGAAYAAFAGDARTYNQGNNVDVGYMTLSPSGDANTQAKWAAISAAGEEAFSTYSYVVVSNETYTDKTAYYFAEGGEAGTGVAANYTVKQIGDAKSFTVDNQTGKAISKINFKAQAVNGTNGNLTALAASDFKYFLKVTIGTGNEAAVVYLAIDGVENATGEQNLAIAIGATGTISVAICVGYDANVTIPANHVGPAATGANDDARESAEAAKPVNMDNIDFAFNIVDLTPAA